MPNNNRIMPAKRVRMGPIDHMRKDMIYGPQALGWRDVPVDLHERPIEEYRVVGGQYYPQGQGFDINDLLARIYNGVDRIASTLVLHRGLIGRVVTITSVPQRIIQAQFLRGYLLLNPASTTGLTSVGTLFSAEELTGAVTATSATVGVANFNTMRLTLNVTAFSGAGTVTFDAQTLDPVDLTTWITTQTVFSITGTGTHYANLGTLGVDTDFRIFVDVPAGVTITFNMGFILKDGLEGTSTGAAQNIFIGQAGVSDDVGYPLLPGREKAFYLTENVELFAVTAGPSLPLRIFEL